MVKLVILVALVAVALASPTSPGVTTATVGQKDCVQWCKNPIANSVYCCNDGSGTQYDSEVHPGRCPEPRPFCPRGEKSPDPSLCAHDGYCQNHLSKCCFDTCLGHHTCKPAVDVFKFECTEKRCD